MNEKENGPNMNFWNSVLLWFDRWPDIKKKATD